PRTPPEPEAARGGRVAAGADRDERRRAAADAQVDVAAAVLYALAPAEPDASVRDGSSQVAVDDAHEHAVEAQLRALLHDVARPVARGLLRAVAHTTTAAC